MEVLIPPKVNFSCLRDVREELFLVYNETRYGNLPTNRAFALVQILAVGCKALEAERSEIIAELEAAVARQNERIKELEAEVAMARKCSTLPLSNGSALHKPN